MSGTPVHTGELEAMNAFSKQAPVFDSQYVNNTIIQYKRNRVREHVCQFLSPRSSILELNAGTGEDAVYFAGLGHPVHATDISLAMQEVLVQKVNEAGLAGRVSNEICSFTRLEELKKQGPYDYVFSNFAGLNCTSDLAKVLSSFQNLLRPGGYVTLVVLPAFCWWEFLLLFKGKFKTAFRRFSGRKGAKAHIEGEYFRCWYYNPSYIKKQLKDEFELMGLEGLCTFVPPSYIEGFAEKHPTMYRRLVQMEEKRKSKWPWRSTGDYYIITLRKRC